MFVDFVEYCFFDEFSVQLCGCIMGFIQVVNLVFDFVEQEEYVCSYQQIVDVIVSGDFDQVCVVIVEYVIRVVQCIMLFFVGV